MDGSRPPIPDTLIQEINASLSANNRDEAVALLREAANARGDDKLAGIAQWQLEMVRWQRDTQARLQQFRDRRLALEKRQ